MAEDKSVASNVGSSRPIDLAGDSTELIAFALLRYVAQIEQQDESATFDRAWMLDAYAECLEAVQGKRSRSATQAGEARTASKSRATTRKK